MKHFVPFPGASPFLTATVLRVPAGQLHPSPMRLSGCVWRSRLRAAGLWRALPRAGRESGEHGSRGLWRMQWLWPVGPREGGVSMHAEHAAGHDSLPYRDRTAADGLSEIAPLCEDGRSKKACAPFWGHRQEKQAGEGAFEGKVLSHRQQRCDRMAAAGRARCDAGSYGHRQQRCDRMAAAGRAR